MFDNRNQRTDELGLYLNAAAPDLHYPVIANLHFSSEEHFLLERWPTHKNFRNWPPNMPRFSKFFVWNSCWIEKICMFSAWFTLYKYITTCFCFLIASAYQFRWSLPFKRPLSSRLFEDLELWKVKHIRNNRFKNSDNLKYAMIPSVFFNFSWKLRSRCWRKLI